MSDAMDWLVTKRDRLYQQLQSLGDIRQGSISVTFGKCGKKKCVCAGKDHPGHGPHYRWTATRHGKTVAQHLPFGPELEGVRQQIENGRKFNNWYGEFLETNEQICRLRPVPEMNDEKELEALKKNCGGGSFGGEKRD